MKAWPVLAIFALATFLRLYHLRDVPSGLHADEAMNGINGLESWRSGHFPLFYPENNGREGLFINIQAVALGLTGRHETWVLRLVSAIFGILSVVGFYYFTREIFDEATGRLAALFMATSVWHITISRLGTRPISSLFFLLWAAFLWWRSTRQLTDGSRWYWVTAVVGGLLYGLGFHTYTVFRITPLIMASMLPLLIRRYGWPRVLRVSIIFLSAAFLAALPIGLYFLQHPDDFGRRAAEISVFAVPHTLRWIVDNTLKTAGMYTIAGDENWRHNLSGHPMLCLPVALLFLLGTGLAIWRHRWLLLFWFAAALPSILSIDTIPHALRSILTIPAALLAAAIGGVWIARWVAAKKPLRAWGLVPYLLGFALFAMAYQTYFVRWANHPTVRGWYSENASFVASQLLALPPELPKYVLFIPEFGNYVRGLPSSARPIMFLTDTYTTARQQELHIHYLFVTQSSEVPSNNVFTIVVPPPDHL
jgi:4-amino-4-deoxy-L-arabinose transferase-like glycosyltransferase